jgi:hypothetical protein
MKNSRAIVAMVAIAFSGSDSDRYGGFKRHADNRTHSCADSRRSDSCACSGRR